MIAAQIIALAINPAWGDWGQEGGCVGHQPSPSPLRRSCQGAGVAHCFGWSCQLHIALLQRRREPCLSGGITIKAAYRVILACGQAADGAANCMAESNRDLGNGCAALGGSGASDYRPPMCIYFDTYLWQRPQPPLMHNTRLPTPPIMHNKARFRQTPMMHNTRPGLLGSPVLCISGP